MSILSQLARAQNRRDEKPNQELALRIADANDKKAVAELVANLNNKSKDVQSDCIKTLDEVAKLKPKLVAPYIPDLLALLSHKNNRLQWGAMTALHAVADQDLKAIYTALPAIIACADRGSVITNDHCMGILVKLCSRKEYLPTVFPLMQERLLTCPVNQLPMYAENALSVVDDKNKKAFLHTLTTRLADIEQESKRKRIEKVMRKLSAG